MPAEKRYRITYNGLMRTTVIVNHFSDALDAAWRRYRDEIQYGKIDFDPFTIESQCQDGGEALKLVTISFTARVQDTILAPDLRSAMTDFLTVMWDRNLIPRSFGANEITVEIGPDGEP